MNSLIRVAVPNVVSKVLSFGIGGKKFPMSIDRNTPEAVDVAATKFQVKLLPVVIVCDCG